MNKIVKRGLEAILAATLITTPIKAQNIVTVQSQDVPSLKNSDAKIVLDDGTKKYWGIMENGQIQFNLPSNTYMMTVEEVGTYFMKSSKIITTNQNIIIQPVDSLKLDTRMYTFLGFIKTMMAANGPNYVSHHFHPVPIRHYEDLTNIPSFARGVQDTILAKIIRNTNNAVKFRKATMDSVGTRIKYVDDAHMPPNGKGEPGYMEANLADDNGYYDITKWISTTANQNVNNITFTITRETLRGMNFGAFSQDPNHVLRANGITGPLLQEPSNDEYKLIEVGYLLNFQTYMPDYIDSVVSNYILWVPDSPLIVYPQNNSINVSTKAKFIWRAVSYQLVDKYSFELAKDTSQVLLQDTSIVDTMLTLDSLDNKTDYFWRIKSHNNAGWSQAKWNKFTSSTTGVEDTPKGPNKFRLYQNYPNPFNFETTIEYDLGKRSKVNLSIFDMLGREVANITNATLNPGHYTTKWNANGLASGTYIYRLQTENNITIKKMLLMK